MKRVIVLLAVCVMLFVISIQAQAPQGPPKPGPEVKRLDYNIGTWNTTGEAKAFGPMPGGKFTATEKCEWYSGGFFVMCHSEGTGPMGPAKGVSFMGYDPNEKVYTYHEFTSTGEAIDSKGTVNGDTWNWTAESKMGDAKISVRVTIKEVSKTEYTFKLEMSQNGGEFSVVEEATAHKVTAAAPAKKS
ncbi:MAG TPA: DUF1579 family protein [Candidatus Acidoferrum sp.]